MALWAGPVTIGQPRLPTPRNLHRRLLKLDVPLPPHPKYHLRVDEHIAVLGQVVGQVQLIPLPLHHQRYKRLILDP
nr:hypothetical protein [Leptolyngbya sp. KIOST-1]